MGDYDLIISYKEMKSIKKICEELEIDYSNLINGKTSKENEKKVADRIKVECFKMYSIIKMMEEK